MITIIKTDRVSLEHFLDDNGIHLDVAECKDGFRASMRNAEIMNRGMLHGSIVVDDSVSGVLSRVCDNLSFKRLAVNAYTENRVEVDVPKLYVEGSYE